MTFYVVAFKHPDESRSVLYRKCERIETLLKHIEDSEKEGANLWSVRKT